VFPADEFGVSVVCEEFERSYGGSVLPSAESLGVLPADEFGMSVVCEAFEGPWVVNGGLMSPLRCVWQGDATGEYRTLVGASGPLRKALEAAEAVAGCLSGGSKSGGGK